MELCCFTRGIFLLTWPLLDPFSLENLFLVLFSLILLVFIIDAMVGYCLC
ncbi:hypothetical protein MtrunA17_Chr4g0067731 [Medicago truncatula]|uniref:Transmembrane protein n=1 Tax=Medicago truncatula TaxID=3880 RepID=A0A396IFE8_MEDTR|nr:hypothetical protein MtrunA17_Chr4g0067731 [Medicago truncatula]